MVYDATTSVGSFLDASAARQPIPGGGAAAAMTGALAASMAEMVLNYSVNKKGLEHFQSELKPALEKVHNARKALTELMVEDQAAYLAMSALRKLPADSPERVQNWEAVVATAVQVPQAIVATSVALLEICDNVINFVNPMLLSDLAVATDLAMAAARCGVYNVRINLPEVADAAARTQIEATINELMSRAIPIVRTVGPRIWDRISQGV